jgi:hypothetical protein
MTLANYITDLLYRYDCVIVPNFGGFVTNKLGARVNQITHSFSPPAKQITFNAHLKHNDGLLANYIAKSENISFQEANRKIANEIFSWDKKLKTETLVLNHIGQFSLNKDQQIIFEPNASINYLTDSFGLSSFQAPTIKRNQQKSIPIQTAPKERSIPTFIKYAAAAAILLIIGTFGFKTHKENQEKAFFENQEKVLEKKIQSATFIISNPLPTIELTVSKTTPKPFHIIAGAFQFPENADRKRTALIVEGFKAKILGVNKWGLTQVTFDSFENRTDALKKLKEIRKNISKDAWILTKRVN